MIPASRSTKSSAWTTISCPADDGVPSADTPKECRREAPLAATRPLDAEGAKAGLDGGPVTVARAAQLVLALWTERRSHAGLLFGRPFRASGATVPSRRAEVVPPGGQDFRRPRQASVQPAGRLNSRASIPTLRSGAVPARASLRRRTTTSAFFTHASQAFILLHLFRQTLLSTSAQRPIVVWPKRRVS